MIKKHKVYKQISAIFLMATRIDYLNITLPKRNADEIEKEIKGRTFSPSNRSIGEILLLERVDGQERTTGRFLWQRKEQEPTRLRTVLDADEEIIEGIVSHLNDYSFVYIEQYLKGVTSAIFDFWGKKIDDDERKRKIRLNEKNIADCIRGLKNLSLYYNSLETRLDETIVDKDSNGNYQHYDKYSSQVQGVIDGEIRNVLRAKDILSNNGIYTGEVTFH